MKRKKEESVIQCCTKMQLRQIALLFCFILLSAWGVMAQSTKQISGKVIDEFGEPIPGVRVSFMTVGQEKPTVDPRFVTISSGTGDFTVGAADGGELHFVFIGLKEEVVSVDDRRVYNVTMRTDVEDIQEVVVTGIFTRKTESYTGASNTIAAEELQSFGNRDVLTSIRNIEPSFNIIESNILGSDPNATPTVQIRGSSSVPNVSDLRDEASAYLNTPLVILDGFESTMTVLQDMNENDIESITILKDASATAIYGSRGANGVVVISTKQPKAGKLRITWRSDLTLEAPDLTQYDLLNAREKLDLEQKYGLYESENVEKDLALKRYYNAILADVNKGVDTYWLSKPLRVGVGQKHSLRFEGGDGKLRYAASLQFNDINGVMKGSEKETFNGAIKLIYSLKNVKVQNNLMIGTVNSANSPYGSFSDYVKLNPYWTGYDEDGNIVKELGAYEDAKYQYRWNKLPANPLYNATLNTFDIAQQNSITNNTSVEWTVTRGLLFRAQLGLTKSNNTSDKYKPAEHTDFASYSGDDFFKRGSYDYGSGSAFAYDASLNLSYNTVLQDKHFVFAGLNYNINQNESTAYGFKAIGFTNEQIDFLGSALQYAEGASPSGTESLTRSVGVTSNLNYMYDEKYLADFSLRMDGSSQFGSDKRFAPFWSTGLGWNLHKEDFMKNKIVNRLKLRASIGTSGSQNFSSYQALSTYEYYGDDRYYNWSGAKLMALGNEDLQWQQKFNQNIGVDAEFLKGRITASFDLYKENTDGMISSVNLAPSNGFDSYVANIGEVKNSGFEFNVMGYLIRDYEKGISWNLGVSGVHNVNELVELSPALKEAQKELENNEDYYVDPNKLYREGYSMNTIWVVRSLGIDPSSGKELFLKKNGETTFIWDSEDLIDGGETTPVLQGNINSSFRYKNLSLTMSLGYRLGGQIYNSTLINKVENADVAYNVDQRVYDDRWMNPGDVAAFKALNNTAKTYKSTRFVQNESTLTMQNINIKYDIKPLFKNWKNSTFESFVLNANASNLFYLSSVKQERGTSYPFARNFSFGVNVVF